MTKRHDNSLRHSYDGISKRVQKKHSNGKCCSVHRGQNHDMQLLLLQRQYQDGLDLQFQSNYP